MLDQVTRAQAGKVDAVPWRAIRFAVWSLIGLLFLATVIAVMWACIAIAQVLLDTLSSLAAIL